MKIKPHILRRADITVPGSKSYSHRILIAAALSDGACRIKNCLRSEDTHHTIKALQQLGVRIDEIGNDTVVHGRCGELNSLTQPLFLGNSGTSMRFLTALAGLGKGTVTLLGTRRMHERPMADLLDGLNQLGISARSKNNNGCPPVEVEGGRNSGGVVKLRCAQSSQFLSAILLIAPYLNKDMEIHVIEGPVSRPYIDMTLTVMERFGVQVERQGHRFFRVNAPQTYHAGFHEVEPDASQAAYFWASAAITGADIKVKGIRRDSIQGDLRLVSLLESMGCQSIQEEDGMRVIGGRLSAVETDMGDMPDMVPTLAVVAAFAEGTTVIKNVAHLRGKESNRLTAVVRELNKMGIRAVCSDDGMIIPGGVAHGASIETYNDHRMAMSFAMAGLVVPGIDIQDPMCVQKSFPDFWGVFKNLYA